MASAIVWIETVRSLGAWVDALQVKLEWLGDDELGPAFAEYLGEVLMPLRFPDADRGPIEDLKAGVTMLAERARQWTEQWFAESRETGLKEGLEQDRRNMAVRLARG